MDQYHNTQVYVRYLDEQIDDKRLYAEFAPFGIITATKITLKNGRSKGFVSFSSPESAKKAVVEMNGKIIGTKQVRVTLIPRKVYNLLNKAPMRPRSSATGNVTSMLRHKFNSINLDCSENACGTSGLSQGYCSMSLNNPQSSDIPTAAGKPNAQAQQQREILGARLYSIIYNKYPGVAVELSGMLLQTDFLVLERLLNNPKCLEERIEEALSKLKEFRGEKGTLCNKEKEKQILREQILPLVKEVNSDLAEQITEILLDTNSSELQGILKSKDYRKTKVKDAIYILKTKAAAQAKMQKQDIGEILYPLVYEMYPSYAGKLTGMLLEGDKSELLHLLENKNDLKMKVDVAFLVYQGYLAHEANLANESVKGEEATLAVKEKIPMLVDNSAGEAAAMLNASHEETVTIESQTEMLKQKLHELISQIYPEMADEITNLLLKLAPTELIYILEHRHALKKKLEEVIAIVRAKQAKHSDTVNLH